MENKYSYKIVNAIFIFLLASTIFSINVAANDQNSTRSINVKVDPRVELMSIIFRLAGNPEYNRSQFFAYVGDIEKHFGQFKEHPVVELAR